MIRRGKSVRRPVGYWQEFNEWYRCEIGRLGDKPDLNNVEAWFNENASRIWGDEERPGWKEARVHAKSLRSTDEVKSYFQRYRAGKKEKMLQAEPKSIDSPPGVSTRALEYRPILSRAAQEEASLALLVSQHNAMVANMSQANVSTDRPSPSDSGPRRTPSVSESPQLPAFHPSSVAVYPQLHAVRTTSVAESPQPHAFYPTLYPVLTPLAFASTGSPAQSQSPSLSTSSAPPNCATVTTGMDPLPASPAFRTEPNKRPMQVSSSPFALSGPSSSDQWPHHLSHTSSPRAPLGLCTQSARSHSMPRVMLEEGQLGRASPTPGEASRFKSSSMPRGVHAELQLGRASPAPGEASRFKSSSMPRGIHGEGQLGRASPAPGEASRFKSSSVPRGHPDSPHSTTPGSTSSHWGKGPWEEIHPTIPRPTQAGGSGRREEAHPPSSMARANSDSPHSTTPGSTSSHWGQGPWEEVHPSGHMPSQAGGGGRREETHHASSMEVQTKGSGRWEEGHPASHMDLQTRGSGRWEEQSKAASFSRLRVEDTHPMPFSTHQATAPPRVSMMPVAQACDTHPMPFTAHQATDASMVPFAQAADAHPIPFGTHPTTAAPKVSMIPVAQARETHSAPFNACQATPHVMGRAPSPLGYLPPEHSCDMRPFSTHQAVAIDEEANYGQHEAMAVDQEASYIQQTALDSELTANDYSSGEDLLPELEELLAIKPAGINTQVPLNEPSAQGGGTTLAWTMDPALHHRIAEANSFWGAANSPRSPRPPIDRQGQGRAHGIAQVSEIDSLFGRRSHSLRQSPSCPQPENDPNPSYRVASAPGNPRKWLNALVDSAPDVDAVRMSGLDSERMGGLVACSFDAVRMSLTTPHMHVPQHSVYSAPAYTRHTTGGFPPSHHDTATTAGVGRLGRQARYSAGGCGPAGVGDQRNSAGGCGQGGGDPSLSCPMGEFVHSHGTASLAMDEDVHRQRTSNLAMDENVHWRRTASLAMDEDDRPSRTASTTMDENIHVQRTSHLTLDENDRPSGTASTTTEYLPSKRSVFAECGRSYDDGVYEFRVSPPGPRCAALRHECSGGSSSRLARLTTPRSSAQPCSAWEWGVEMEETLELAGHRTKSEPAFLPYEQHRSSAPARSSLARQHMLEPAGSSLAQQHMLEPAGSCLAQQHMLEPAGPCPMAEDPFEPDRVGRHDRCSTGNTRSYLDLSTDCLKRTSSYCERPPQEGKGGAEPPSSFGHRSSRSSRGDPRAGSFLEAATPRNLPNLFPNGIPTPSLPHTSHSFSPANLISSPHSFSPSNPIFRPHSWRLHPAPGSAPLVTRPPTDVHQSTPPLGLPPW